MGAQLQITTEYFWAIVLMIELVGVASFIVIWWLTTISIKLLKREPMHRTDEVTIGIIINAISTAALALMSIPAAFFIGLNLYYHASEWVHKVAPGLVVFLALNVFGYLLKILFSWNRYTGPLFIIGLTLWHALWLGVGWMIGGFDLKLV